MYVICPTCQAQTRARAPHGYDPCPQATAEHEVRLAVLAAQRRYWLALAAVADRTDVSDALTAVDWPAGPGVPGP